MIHSNKLTVTLKIQRFQGISRRTNKALTILRLLLTTDTSKHAYCFYLLNNFHFIMFYYEVLTNESNFLEKQMLRQCQLDPIIAID